MLVKLYKTGEHAPTFTYTSSKGEDGTVREVQTMFAVDFSQVRGGVLEILVKSQPG